MARRGQPQPSYLTSASAPSQRAESGNAFTRFINEELLAPEKLAGNLSIATGVTVFAAGVAVIRTWGELMIPA
jgi:hypothetical protein